jgi:hypothetical protein
MPKNRLKMKENAVNPAAVAANRPVRLTECMKTFFWNYFFK